MTDARASPGSERVTWVEIGREINGLGAEITKLWLRVRDLYVTVEAYEDTPASRHVLSSLRALERSIVALRQAEAVQLLRAEAERG